MDLILKLSILGEVETGTYSLVWRKQEIWDLWEGVEDLEKYKGPPAPTPYQIIIFLQTLQRYH